MLESFAGDRTGSLRISWKTASIAAGAPGHFRLSVHSAISGRVLAVAVDRESPGSGVAYVSEEARMFYSVVESTGLDWSFTVEERVN